MRNSNLTAEWQLLQNQFDAYEKCSLVIKLAAFFFCFVAMQIYLNQPVLLLFFAALWLLDGIWKTFQSRIETRLLVLEQAIADQENNRETKVVAFQFNTAFLQTRVGGAATLVEYIRQALRPTVAVVYVLLIAVWLVSYCI